MFQLAAQVGRFNGTIYFWRKKIWVLIHGRVQCYVTEIVFCLLLRDSSKWARTSSFTGFRDKTQWRTTVGWTPLDKWSARRRDLSLTTHNTHNKQTSMTSVGLEPTIPAGERAQTYALDRASTGTGLQE